MLLRAVALALLLTPPLLAADWSHWRGPDRQGTSPEDSGWELGAWPPREVWQTNVGLGGSSPLVIAGRVYTTGWNDDADTVVCLDAASGRELWRQSYRAPKYGRNAAGDQSLYAGPSSTPEYDEATKHLYTLGNDGDLNCWDTTQQGRAVWHVNLYDRYHLPKRPAVGNSGQRDYGYTSSPRVYHDWLLVEAGGDRGTVVALDKKTGAHLWGSQARCLAGHAGGIELTQVQGVDCAVVLAFDGLLAVRLDRGQAGQTIGFYPYQTEFANSIVQPVALGDEVLITSGYNHETLTKLRLTLSGIKKVWEQPRLHSKVCTPVLHRGRLYWSYMNVYCVDWQTGKLTWKGRSGGADGSCIVTADDRLLVWANKGDLLLAETATRSPNSFKVLASVKRLFRTEVWPHLALSDGRLFCKDRAGNLKCLSLRKETTPPRAITNTAPPEAGSPPRAPVNLKEWPGQVPGLVLAWASGMGIGAIGPGAQSRDALSLHARGAARFTSEGYLNLSGGAFLVEGADAALLEACRQSDELSLEVVFQTANLTQDGPSRLLSFSDDPYLRNFTLGQARDKLILRLRTPRTGENGQRPELTLCPIEANRWHHILVTYRPGQLHCYLDGERVVDTDRIQGDFSNWSPMHLLLGDEFKDNRDWQGLVERVAVLNRFVEADEARQRYKSASGGADAATVTTPVAAPQTTLTPPLATPAGTFPLRVTELADWQGQRAWQIETPTATYVFQPDAGGFASLLDRQGNDWISFRPTGGSAGSYRGLPNLIHPEGGFHPGSDKCASKIVEATAQKVVLTSATADGQWSCRWTILDDCAVMDLDKAAHSYWFLYEGTPGGRYDEQATWMLDSSGKRTPASQRWERRLPEPRWLCFGVAQLPRVLFLADLTDRPADAVDSFWSMQKNMTVFGFGRQLSNKDNRWHHLVKTPARFALGLVESVDQRTLKQTLDALCQRLR